MIRVEKDLSKVPNSLKDKKRMDAHRANCAAGRYDSADTYYKQKDVKEALDALYHKKCAYCEKGLLDTFRPIEHYRPKNSHSKLNKCDASFSYYWLSFSWDNLLLACSQCNGFKSSCFDIEGDRAAYESEVLSDLHGKATDYDTLEKPMLINPEREENLETIFDFLPDGKYHTSDPRMLYTIEHCGLERDELIEKRIEIKNKLISDLESCFEDFTHNRDLNVFFSAFRSFGKNLSRKKQFFAWKNYLWNNLRTIIDEIEDPNFSTASLAAYLRYTKSA
jgi:uncharacterized protein (TIGR02646 family)